MKILFISIIFIIALLVIVFKSDLIFSTDLEKGKHGNYKWQLTFEDNFNNLDKNKWQTIFKSGVRTIWSNKELQWYKDENAVIENGILKLIVKKETIYGKDAESEKQFEFTSGLITTAKTFSQAYGKWEMKVKFPFRKGFWPAFWIVANQQPGLPEVDIFEYFGRKENEMYVNQHWGIDYPNYAGGTYEGKTEPFYNTNGKNIIGDFSNEWMVWTLEIFPDKIYWKLNDKIVFESTKGIPTSPMYIIANVAVKDWDENNKEVDNSDEPYIMEIDYIKAYKIIPE